MGRHGLSRAKLLRCVAAPLLVLLVSPADWREVWQTFLRVRSSDGVAAAREAAGVLAADLDDPLRGDLLAAAGGDAPAAARLEGGLTGVQWPLDELESWLAAEALAPGLARGRAVLAALEGAGAGIPAERMRLAYEVGVEAAEDLRLEQALAIQHRLHREAGAEWSAMNLALSLRRVGDYAGADAVLAEQAEARGASPDLLSQRGLNALAAGDETAARRWLGAALARGSQDAGVILARRDLALGRRTAARRAFGALLVEGSGAWALRGWGVSMVEDPLPAPSAAPGQSPGAGSPGGGSPSVP